MRVGVIMLETRFPRPPGDIGNPETFGGRALYDVVPGAAAGRVVRAGSPDPALLAPFLASRDRLVHAGAGLVTTSCGFLVRFQAALAENWTWGRIDRLVRAILLAGAYELVHRRDVPPKVAINEYVEIAHAFYVQGESTFVNSVLDRVARQERAADLAG